MAERGAPIGNKNAVNGKRWREAILRALARKTNSSVDAGLDAAADKLVSLAIDHGEQWAILEMGNRLDGKPAQSVQVTGEDGGPVQIQTIEIKAVDP